MTELTVYTGPRVDPAPFAAWSTRHARIFNLTSDGDQLMLAEWCKIFALHRYAAEELEEATTFIAANCPPRFRTDHLPALEGRVKERRRLLASRRPAHQDRGACESCGNTALVAVPADGLLSAGGNVYGPGTEAVVTCKCVIGRMAAQNDVRKKKLLTLEEYERSHPYWKDERDRRRELARLRANSMTGSAMMDKTLGSILKRLQDRELGSGI